MLAPWVPVEMADGSSRPAGALRPGDKLRGAICLGLERLSTSCYEVVLTDSRGFEMAAPHRVQLSGGKTRVEQLFAGDVLLGPMKGTVQTVRFLGIKAVIKIIADEPFLTSGIYGWS